MTFGMSRQEDGGMFRREALDTVQALKAITATDHVDLDSTTDLVGLCDCPSRTGPWPSPAAF